MPVTNHSTNRIRGMTLGLCIGLQLAACHPKPPQAKTAGDAAANDAKLVERIEKMRARAKNAVPRWPSKRATLNNKLAGQGRPSKKPCSSCRKSG
jgi:hypothetical protein